MLRADARFTEAGHVDATVDGGITNAIVDPYFDQSGSAFGCGNTWSAYLGNAATSTLVPPDSGLTHACELCITASSTSAVLLAVGPSIRDVQPGQTFAAHADIAVAPDAGGDGSLIVSVGARICPEDGGCPGGGGAIGTPLATITSAWTSQGQSQTVVPSGYYSLQFQALVYGQPGQCVLVDDATLYLLP
jgi:hypothetical protein